MRVIFNEEKGKNMERYVKAALAVAMIAFLVTFGLAMLPMLVALFGAAIGVLIGFAPLTIAVVLVVVLANTVFKK
jgi:hypothetical protein